MQISSAAAAAAAGELCGKAEGPFDLKRKGAPALFVRRGSGEADTVFVILNDGGRPDVRAFGARAGAEPRNAEGPTEEKASSIPCAVAAGHVYCPDKEGVVRHATLGEGARVEGAEIVAQSRPGSLVTAAALGADHTVLGFLVDAVGASGPVTEAFVSLDGKKAVKLSDEGAGATFVALAARGDEVVAMYVDGRSGLTPVHARVLRLDGGALSVGTDAVLYVGGPFERYTTGAVGTTSKGTAFALVPLSVDDRTFALGAFRVDATPRDDAARAWSKYPNGLDPAPIAATANDGAIVALLGRPASAEPQAKRVLELGKLAEDGGFVPGCVVDASAQHLHVAVAGDRFGATWLAWSGAKGSFVARRGGR